MILLCWKQEILEILCQMLQRLYRPSPYSSPAMKIFEIIASVVIYNKTAQPSRSLYITLRLDRYIQPMALQRRKHSVYITTHLRALQLLPWNKEAALQWQSPSPNRMPQPSPKNILVVCTRIYINYKNLSNNCPDPNFQQGGCRTISTSRLPRILCQCPMIWWQS